MFNLKNKEQIICDFFTLENVIQFRRLQNMNVTVTKPPSCTKYTILNDLVV